MKEARQLGRGVQFGEKANVHLELSVKSLKEGGTKLWVWSFFEKNFYQELVGSSCIGVYFESWVKMGPLFFTSQTLRES